MKHRRVETGADGAGTTDDTAPEADGQRTHATLLERIQCLGMLGAIRADAKRRSDAETEVDALSNCLLVNSPDLTHAHVRTLQDKCARMGAFWTPAVSAATHRLPAALWQHLDGFLCWDDSLQLMATCRFMMFVLLGHYPRPNVDVLHPDQMLRAMRAVPGRFTRVGLLEFSAFDLGGDYDWDALHSHIVETFGVGGPSVHTLRMGGDEETWFRMIRCCPNVRAIELTEDYNWDPKDVSRLLEAATECTSLLADVAFDNHLKHALVVPARVSAVEIRYNTHGRLEFEDASQVRSLILPGTADFNMSACGAFVGLERLHYPRLADAAVVGALPRLLELTVHGFTLADGRWIPDSLERLVMHSSFVGHRGLAHCLRPESRLVSVRCDECQFDEDTDTLDDAITHAFRAVAAAGRVAPALRELMLPRVPIDTSANTVAGLVSDGGDIAMLGRDSHAAFDPRFGQHVPVRQGLAADEGLLLLLRSNRCAVGFGSRLVFQGACSKNCVHALATDI